MQRQRHISNLKHGNVENVPQSPLLDACQIYTASRRAEGPFECAEAARSSRVTSSRYKRGDWPPRNTQHRCFIGSSRRPGQTGGGDGMHYWKMSVSRFSAARTGQCEGLIVLFRRSVKPRWSSHSAASITTAVI